jgi:hypothetical protein
MDKNFMDVFKCPHFTDIKNESRDCRDCRDWHGYPQVTIENFGLTEKDFENTETVFDYEWDDDACTKLENARKEHDDHLREHLTRVSEEDGTNLDIDKELDDYWDGGSTTANDYPLPIRVSKEQIAKCLLFISAKYSSTNTTLAKWLEEFVEDSVGTRNKSNKKWYKTYGSTVTESWSSGNLIDFICSFETKDLFARGW